VSAQDYAAGSSITNGEVVRAVNNQYNLAGRITATGTTNVVSWNGAKAFDFRAGGNFFQTNNNVGITGEAPSTIILVGAAVNTSGGFNGTGYHIGISWGGIGTYLSRAVSVGSSGFLRAVWYSNDLDFTSSPLPAGRASVMVIRDVNGISALGNISQTAPTNDTSRISHPGPNNTTDGPVRIGQWKDSADQYPFGYIAEALIYDRSLSDTEVQAITDYFNNLYLIKGYTSTNPLTSPTEAATVGLPSGNYWFKSSSMASSEQLFYSGPNYYDSSSYVRVFSAPYASTATLNKIQLNIPYTKLLVQRNDAAFRGVARFSTAQQYNLTPNPGVGATSTANSFGGSTTSMKVLLGYAGGHGIYGPNQGTCGWGAEISGAIGAGWDGATCGDFPNNLKWGYVVGNTGPVYDGRSGTWEHWVTW
jgi:hypothetical protein